METAIGEVSAVDGNSATVTISSSVTCRRCAAGRGCGAALTLRGERLRHIEIDVPPGIRLQAGDPVRLAISPRHLATAAMLAYGLPLAVVLAFLAVAAATGAGLGDGQAVLVALAGLACGFAISRRLLAGAAVCRKFVPVFDGQPGPD